jgi:hypothetical protein
MRGRVPGPEVPPRVEANGTCPAPPPVVTWFTPLHAENKAIQSIELDASVTHIGSGAFVGCSRLTRVTFPAGLRYIGLGAFAGCVSLTQVCLPRGVAHIGAFAFVGCSSLRVVDVPVESALAYLGDSAFMHCRRLTAIRLPPWVARGYLGAAAFKMCTSLESVSLPSGLRHIPPHAFAECWNLRAVDLPDSITSIGTGAFHYCPLSSELRLPPSVRCIGAYAFAGGQFPSVHMPGVVNVGSGAFQSCHALANVEWPCLLRRIGERAFRGTDLRVVDLRSCHTLEHISRGAFSECPLVSFVAPDCTNLDEGCLGPGAVWAQTQCARRARGHWECVRRVVQVAPYAMAWLEHSCERLCAPAGSWRQLDHREFEAWARGRAWHAPAGKANDTAPRDPPELT